jgi:hypothetical protein
MEIPSQHAECQRVGAGHVMEEGFLFNGVALQRAYISPWHAQLSALIKSHLANAAFPFSDLAAMSTCVTFNRVIRKLLI